MHDDLTLPMQAVVATCFAEPTEPYTLARGPRRRLGAVQEGASRFAAEQSCQTGHPSALHVIKMSLYFDLSTIVE